VVKHQGETWRSHHIWHLQETPFLCYPLRINNFLFLFSFKKVVFYRPYKIFMHVVLAIVVKLEWFFFLKHVYNIIKSSSILPKKRKESSSIKKWAHDLISKSRFRNSFLKLVLFQKIIFNSSHVKKNYNFFNSKF